MTRLPIASLWMSGLLLLGCAVVRGSSSLPPWPDLVELLRTNIVRAPGEFDREASEALIQKFGGRILAADAVAEPVPDIAPIVKRDTFGAGARYIRVGQVSLGLAPQLEAAIRDTNWTSGARGLVLDLRAAAGNEFNAAAQVTGLFAGGDLQPLNWGDQTEPVPPREPAWKLPAVVLINGETSGAAEALAAALRVEIGALVIGSPSAGRAAVFRELPLPDGSRLRVPSARVRTSDGAEIPAEGITPDLVVRIRPELERAYLADPFTNLVAKIDNRGTNQVTPAPARRRVNEAELVRAQRDGTIPGDGPASETNSVRIVRDPVLARGLDFLNGLGTSTRRKRS
jgi:hypothetical protein